MNRGTLLLSAVLALLAGFVGAALGSRYMERPMVQPLSEHVFGILEKDAELSEGQKVQIRSLVARYATRRDRLRTQSRQINVSLARAVSTEQGLDQETRTLLARLQNVMGQRLTLSLSYMIEARRILTPEQRILFDRRIAEEASTSR